MLSIRDTLLWYKQPAVRAAMVHGAQEKEIGIRYGDGFGKRPDAIEYEQEILDVVQRGATSFHASEELWSNPRSIETGMSKRDLDSLRTGWDLVLDIDFTDFEATKLITQALCEALDSHGVTAYGVKFSGNKGFHIGVAWEAFPKEFAEAQTATLFPDLTRQIASYLVYCVDNPENGFRLSEALEQLIGKSEELQKVVCGSCGRDRIDVTRATYFVCPKCGHNDHTVEDLDYLSCATCASFMERVGERAPKVEKCLCGSVEARVVFDLKIDTQLISSRHLYRLEYSLHEKSGLVSLPIPKTDVLSFTKERAKPENVTAFPQFWDRSTRGQATALVTKARAFRPHDESKQVVQREVVWDDDAAPEEAFPPTIRKILLGMTDGKKRALFILTNFLRSVGWNYDMMEQRLREWNDSNEPPLRENDLVSHLRYHKSRKETVLPPNFDNDVYKDLGVLELDELSSRVKNPVQYVRLKLKQRGKA